MIAASRIALSTIAALSLTAAFAPQPAPPEPLPAGTAVIRGRIFAADTGRPLRRARIVVSSSEIGVENRSAVTDPDGRYEIADLTAGRYTVSVYRSGYLSVTFGQRRPLEPGQPLDVRDKQTLERVDFTLPRMSGIAGRVTDEAGEPIAGVRVYVLRSVYFEGRRRLVPATGNVTTDDAGRYRVPGVMPGSYFVLGTLRETWPVTENRVEHVIAYSPTYFPGTRGIEEARRVTVGIGEQTTNTDFSMIPGRAANVSGLAIDSRGRPLGGETIYLTQEFRGPTGANMVEFGAGPLAAADGTFTISNVPPGEYKLNMHADRPEGVENGATSISVDGANLEHVTVTTSEGWSATGRVTTEDGAPPNLRPDRVRIVGRPISGDAEPRKAGGNPDSGRVKDDWTFSVTRVYGPARLRVVLPDGWTVKAVVHDGRDITDTPLAPRNGEVLSGVQVILTNRVTRVTGQLSDDKGAPLTDGTIIVFSSDSEKWAEDSRFVRATRPDQRGQYRIRGMPPGEYLAVAVDYVQEGLWNDPEYLGTLRRYAQRLALIEGGSQAISLTISAP